MSTYCRAIQQVKQWIIGSNLTFNSKERTGHKTSAPIKHHDILTRCQSPKKLKEHMNTQLISMTLMHLGLVLKYFYLLPEGHYFRFYLVLLSLALPHVSTSSSLSPSLASVLVSTTVGVT